MTLANATELKAEIVADLARSDVLAASAVLDRWIVQTERLMNTRLRVKEMERVTTLTINTELEDLPADFLELVHLEFDDTPQAVNNVNEQLLASTGAGATTGVAKKFAIVYNDTTDLYQLRFGPIPSGSRTAKLTYYAKLATLSGGANATNALFLKHPTLYLDGCLYFAFKKFRNRIEMGQYQQDFADGINLVIGETNNQILSPGTRMRPSRVL